MSALPYTLPVIVLAGGGVVLPSRNRIERIRRIVSGIALVLEIAMTVWA